MAQEQFFFSIVIPTYNRPERSQTCLKSLTCLDYPRDRFEVIVVDDGSAKPLESVLLPFKEELNLQLIRQANAGPAAARNTGAASARGKFLVFTDDDCTLAPNWLTTLEAHFTTASDRIIGGKTINALPDNPYSSASQLIIDAVYAHYNAIPENARFFASNNLALSAESFRALGGFNPSFLASEDRELCDRWLARGYKMLYVPEAQIYHAHNLTLRSFWHQHFNYGRGAFRFHQLRSQRETNQAKVEPGFYYKLLAYPFVQTTSKQPKLLLVALFAISQIASTMGIFWERSDRSVSKAESKVKGSIAEPN
jgi:GT2 family glycosyltransferase